MSDSFTQAVARGARRWGPQYVAPDSSPSQRKYFQDGRVEITTTYPSGETWARRGRISITTGWAPCLLLMARVSDHGSSDCLKSTDIVTAWIDARGGRHPITYPVRQA